MPSESADSVFIRLYAARHKKPSPAQPRSIAVRCVATLAAVAREASNYAPPLPALRRITLPQPALGSVLLVLAHFILVIVLCFYKVRSSARYDNQNIAYRTGYVSLAQLPLIVLLSAKNNIIGFLTGLSYERLNWLHRWTARALLLTTTLHMGYWFADWAPYGDYITQKVTTDSVTQWGVAAWAILVWIVVSSMTPIRGWNYEFFVIQHVISFVAFFAMVYLHLPTGDWTWLWVCLAIFLFDRVVRGLYVFYTNCALFHPRQRREGSFSGLWASRAELTPLSGNMTRITIRDPPMNWRPGQHAFVSLHTVVPLQSHPFTIASIPQDGVMEFLVKAHRGGTKRFFSYAERNHGLPSVQNAQIKTVAVSLEGPYGRMRPLGQFDSVILFGGSTGATFTMPLLRDIVQGWRKDSLSQEKGLQANAGAPTHSVTRRVRFVWVIKSREQLSWFSSRLFEVMDDVDSLRREGLDVMVEASVYVTCDDGFTADGQTDLRSSAKQGAKQTEAEITINDLGTGMSLGADTLKKERQSVEIHEVDSRTSNVSGQRETKGCGPRGACCCQTTVNDESPDAIPLEIICHCNCSHNPGSSSSASSMDNAAKTSSKLARPLLHPAIALLSGRPHPRNIIRKTLEGARGESAVVVCGPKGLIRDARRSVVALSDERAVHKGSGAQGIWFWSEGFGW